jgi:high-affinity Fe2+/Pb2+ permease
MDISSVIISLLIVWYGVYEYRRREKAHSVAMEHLRRGEILPAACSKPHSWSLLTTGSVCTLLAGFAGMLFYTGMHLRNHYARPLEIMGCMISIPLLVLAAIFVRDLRRYVAEEHGGKQREQ